MEQQLNVLTKPQDIEALYEYINDFEYIAFDTETTGTERSSEIIGYSICCEEDKAFYVILAAWNKDTNSLTYYPDNLAASRPLLQQLTTKKLWLHNAIFDCMMVENYFKIRLIDAVHIDSMVLAHLLNENRRIGLKELGKHYFGDDSTAEQAEMKASVLANGGVLTKKVYEMFKCDANILGKYGAKDALLTYKLVLKLIPELYEQKLDTFFFDDECMPLLKTATYDLNFTGLRLDMPKLAALKKQLEAEVLIAKHYIQQETKAHTQDKYPGTNKKNLFNIGSSQQLSWLLFGKLGLEFGKLTKEGKKVCKALNIKPPYTAAHKRNFIHAITAAYAQAWAPAYTRNGKLVKAKIVKEPWGYISTDKTSLKPLAEKLDWVKELLGMQKKIKLLKTYIAGMESGAKYGVIHPSFLQTGTPSGRYSSRRPNFQNLPKKEKRIKECVIARPGKVFVGADYSQLEPRVFAYYSQDPRLMAAFDGTTDFYSVIGMAVFNKTDCTPHKEGSPDAFGVKYSHLRDLAKTIALAAAYGSTAWNLMKDTGKSERDTQQDIDNYFEEFEGVQSMMLEAHNIVKAKGCVESLYGRIRRIPEAVTIDRIYGKQDHAEYPYEVRGMLNLACNYRIQSSGASIVNRAMIQAWKDFKAAGIQAQIVTQVHDSIIVECDEKYAEDVSLLLQNAMENTTVLQGVPLEAIPKIGVNFAQV